VGIKFTGRGYYCSERSIVAGGIEFDRSKFKELVIYFVQESARAGDEGFGMVKLNKLLYRADFQAFLTLGQSITGAVYEKQEWGPVARPLPTVLDQLAADGRLYWQLIPRGPYTRKVPTARSDDYSAPDLTKFSADERRMMAAALSDLATHGGKSASNWSHKQSAGWNLARQDGDAIEYETEFISTDPIPKADLERAREYVRDRGWVGSPA
jgi:hypothetical protein